MDIKCHVLEFLKHVVWVKKNNVSVKFDTGCCLMLMDRHFHIENLINLQIIIVIELGLTNLGKL